MKTETSCELLHLLRLRIICNYHDGHELHIICYLALTVSRFRISDYHLPAVQLPVTGVPTSHQAREIQNLKFSYS